MNRLRPYLIPRNMIVAAVALLLVALSVPLGPLALSGPQVVAIAPADGTGDANPQAPIRVEFDQWVSLGSVGSAVTLDPPAEFTVAQDGVPRPWGSAVLIQPKGALRYGARYTLRLNNQVRNILGRAIAQPLTVVFATAPYVTVARFGPAQGARDVALNAPITVEFGTPIVPAEQIAAAAQDTALADSLPKPLALTPETKGIGRWLSPTLYGFYPDGGLHAATEYNATVLATITPDGKARLEKETAWRFTTAAPLLVGTRPYDGATETPAGGPVEVRLAPDVDVDSASAHFALVEAATGVPVTGTITKGGGGFLFAPAQPLQRGARYQARLTPGITTTAGRPLNADPLSWTFSVIGDLEVAHVEPPPDTVEVLTSARRISVRFNHPVVAVTTLDAQGTSPVPVRIDPPVQGVGRWLDTSTYVYSPTAGLAPATSYRVTVAAGLQDQTGGALRQPYEWTFKTFTPQIVEITPATGDQQASPRDPIQVFFNQPMDPASLRSAISLRNGDTGAAVPGTLTLAASTATFQKIDPGTGETRRVTAAFMATFRPNAPLDRGTTYALIVAAGARGATGDGALASEFRSAFRVAPPPRLIGSQPTAGAGEVDAGNGYVSLNFSTPMDWDAVWSNLTIEPKPTEVFTSGYDTNFSISFPFKPETDYRVTVGAPTRDLYGVTFGQAAVVSFRTGSLPPSLALIGAYQIGAYNAYVPARLPLQHVNVPSIDYRLYRMDAAQIPRLLADYDAWQNFSPDDAALVKQASVELAGDRNQQRLDLLDLGRLDAGMYYLVLRGPGDLADRQLLAVSPYALTIKRSSDKLFVWAVDLASGKPASDVPLQATSIYQENTPSATIYTGGEPRDLGRTDGEGILQAPFTTPQMYNPVFLWTPKGDRFAFATTNWGEGIGPWDFGLPGYYGTSPVVGNIATDRPIYRPEQNVYIRGVLRMDHDARYTLPEQGRQVHLTINDPEGKAVFTTTLPLTEFGTFNTSFPLERGAKLGGYSLLARLDNDTDEHVIYGSFSVAEYRKPAFEIVVTSAQGDLIQGDTLKMEVTARYYSGGALASAPVRWRLLADPLYFSSESAPNFRFEDLDDAYEWYRWFDNQREGGGEQVAEGTGQTDAQGHFIVSAPATLGKDNHSRKLRMEVDITDVDGQVITAEGDANVHAGAFYIGLRPEGYVAQVGQPQNAALITLDPQGQPIGNRALTVKIYRREWFSVREQGPDGRFYFTSNYTDTLVETQSAATDAQGHGSISFTPKQGGSYRIGAEGRDDGGHTVRASAFTWVAGGDVFWGINDTARVDLIADKDRYKPGDTAGVLVTAPYSGMTALMTIERGEVIEHKLLTLQSTTELLQVPITGDYAPNVYVSVVLVKPAGGDVPVPDLRVGLVNLPVSTEQQELTITVTPDKQQAGPRDKVTYTVKATDYSGKGVKTEVALALVDKAVLALADDPNPTLKGSFYEKRPLGVFTAQSLTALVDRVTLKLQPGSKGGGGGLDAEVLVRRDFPDTAYWNPALVTGDDGTASVTITLPDSLTTWRMSARGVTADTLVGQASEDIVATRPLLVRPSLPRFLTVGDQPVIQAIVHNNTSGAIDTTATLDIITPDGAVPTMKLGGTPQQTVNAPANGTAVVRWPVEVTSAGQATLRFTIKGGDLQDIAEQTLPVQRYTTPEVVASAGQVSDRPVVETIAPPPQPSPTQGGGSQEGEVDLELAPSLAAGMASGLDYLEQFPYLCAEQTVSRFLPNAVSYRLLRQAGRDDPQLKASLERNLAAGLQRLSTLQNLDGGWGWWFEDKSNAYLTAYVAQGLVEARRAGYGVDQQMFDKAITYLESALNEELRIENAKGSGPDLLNSQLSILNSRSYVLFVLAEAGKPDRGRTIALFEQRARLQIYGRAYLLMTLKTLGGEDTRARTLVGDLMGTAIMHTADAHWEEGTTDYWTMNSDTRTTALALQALVRSDPGNFLVPNAVRYLMGLRDRGHWRTTQESATTLMALAEYIAQSGELEADYSYKAALDGRTLREGTVNRDNLDDPISVVFGLADLKATTDSGQPAAGQGQSPVAGRRSALAIEKSGKGRLYYTLRMRYYQDAASVQPLDQGIGVQREYVAVDTDTLSPTGQLVTQAKLGDLVQVRLTLVVPEDMPYFAVEDMLPAGLEALDTSLKTVSDAAQSPELSEASTDRPYWWYFSQTEIRDNRVALFATDLPKGTYHYTYLARATTAGTFQTLPALAYRMYSPEVFGRSAGAKFVVTGN
jgi:alpha-2-macroglobulin